MAGDDINRLDVHRKVEEFKGIVTQNMQQVAQPDKQPKHPFVPMGSPLDDVTMHQQDQAAAFASHGGRVRQRLSCQNRKLWGLAAGGLVAAALTIFLIACFAGGKSCVSKHGGGGGGGAPASLQQGGSMPAVVKSGDSSLSPGEPNPVGTSGTADGAGSSGDAGATAAAAAPEPAPGDAAAASSPSGEPHFVNNIEYLGVPQGDSTLSPGEPIDVAAESATTASAEPTAAAAAEPTADAAAELAATTAAEPPAEPAAAKKEPHFENTITYLGVPEGDSALSPGAPTAAAPVTTAGRRLMMAH